MKYIRTKDELLIAPNLYDEGGAVLCSDPPQYETRNAKNEWGCVYVKDVIKTADTIEELCDEFVGISDGEPQMLRFVPYACAQYWNGGVYGAVWCEFGLKYVARMNNEGKLELL